MVELSAGLVQGDAVAGATPATTRSNQKTDAVLPVLPAAGARDRGLNQTAGRRAGEAKEENGIAR